MIPGPEALARLLEGNRRFATGDRRLVSRIGRLRRQALRSGQEPFAVVLGCSDSRVPVEIVFDQGLGDLFVIRVAGNIVAPSLIGSVEFAVERLGARLVMVLGHSSCGAVNATLEALRGAGKGASPNLLSIVERIRPAVEEILQGESDETGEERARRAVRANVRASVRGLRDGSQSLRRSIAEEGLLLVGAEYSLETGRVELVDEGPAVA